MTVKEEKGKIRKCPLCGGGMEDGNREAAARLLGIKPHTFRKRAKEKFSL